MSTPPTTSQYKTKIKQLSEHSKQVQTCPPTVFFFAKSFPQYNLTQRYKHEQTNECMTKIAMLFFVFVLIFSNHLEIERERESEQANNGKSKKRAVVC